MFEDLKREVFPAIVSGKPDGPPIRVWVPGCSTGQEAYSVAMALLEFLEDAKPKRAIQIFATDLGDPAFLDKARPGSIRRASKPKSVPNACDVSSSRRSAVPHSEARARPLRVRAAERDRRSAVLSRRSGDVPQRADLHVAAAAGTAAAGLSLCAESGRLSGAGPGRDRRRRSAICSS